VTFNCGFILRVQAIDDVSVHFYGPPPPTGACCRPDGSCTPDVTEAACIATGGSYQGDNTLCDVVSCPQPGACCFSDGSCADFPAPGADGACVAAGGTFQGAGSSCATTVCPQPGACCFANGSCADFPAPGADGACVAAGGTFQGAGSSCATTVCPQPGACCFPNGTCANFPAPGAAAACAAAGGVFQGNNTLCGAIACPQPGACCFPNGTCTDFSAPNAAGACAAAGGIFQGPNTACATTACPQPGACCLPNGSCTQVSAAACAAAGGTASAPGTTCAAVACIQPARISHSEKGSVVIFSKVDLRWNAAGQLIQDTFLQLTNDNNAAVRVKMFFVNGDPPLAAAGAERAHPGWNFIDNTVTLTANQPIYWSANSGLPAGFSPFRVLDPSPTGSPPGRPDPDGSTDRVLRGFIYAIAINSNGQEISWNHLAGNVTVVNYRDATAWEYNGWSVQAVNPAVGTGQATGSPGVINLDGFEFARAPDLVLFNFQATGSLAMSRPGLELLTAGDLTMHPVSTDFRQQNTGPITTKAKFEVWNQNEVKFSGTERCIRCWDERLLANYAAPNHLLATTLQTDFGKARIDGVASTGCTNSQSAALLALHFVKLTFANSGVFTTSGTNSNGAGWQNAVIRFDVYGGEPPTADDPEQMEDPE
jgi:hypothetical protein